MVLKKRLDYGFSGYEIPVIPRAPRSLRRRAPIKNPEGDPGICAFELLAAVAGKLLQQESESSASSNASGTKVGPDLNVDGAKLERVQEINALRSECHDQGSCVESAFVPSFLAENLSLKSTMKDHPHGESNSLSERTSIVTSSDASKKVDCDLKLGLYNDRNVDGSPRKVRASQLVYDLCPGNVESGTETQVGNGVKHIGDLTMPNNASVKKQMEKCMNSKSLINSDSSSVQLSLYRDPVPKACFPKHRNHVNVGIRDDDDNSFRCHRVSTKIRAFKPQVRNNYRRIRKMLSSRYYWKSAPKLREYETCDGMRSFYRPRKTVHPKTVHPRDRNLHEVPSKRRKLSSRNFVVAYDEEASSESISNNPEKVGYNRSDAIQHRASGSPASVKGNSKSKNSSVKLSIKSFKVPELYIEVPETATVGSLKRTVMETVTAILGGGLRVGVVLQGKKVRDDSRTLQQAGISHSGNLDSLGFVLEPSFTEVNEPPKDSPPLLHCEAEQILQGPTSTPIIESGPSSATSERPPVLTMNKQHEPDHEIILSPRTPTDTVTDQVASASRALVPLPAVNAEALALVPMSPKLNKRSESSQRRTRRPFSVGEVEALVSSVEILGTGRWRDVKMRSFENADHRTYVDLKDKWKTLVHTASISPQQRRGEPVPQDLLDRVLSAHSYWSLHQSKQHSKLLLEPLQAVDPESEIIEI